MNRIQKAASYGLLSFLCFSQLLSCSKDSDLLAEYVLKEDVNDVSIYVMDDNFSITNGQSTILDVLNNDQFSNLENVTIVNTTTPENGTVIINSNNTLTYTPNPVPETETPETETPETETPETDTSEPSEPETAETTTETVSDTFDYTVEETTDEGNIITEEGTVTINQETTTTDKSYVNFKQFGAVGDGKTDDTAAIQNALDSEENLFADANATFLISKQLDIDQNFEHDIDWNGANIFTNTNLLYMFVVDKRSKNGGQTNMKNLLLNANKIASRGFLIHSKVNFKNVDAKGFRHVGSQSPAAFQLRGFDDDDAYGTWVFDGCDVDDIVTASDGSITNSKGAGNSVLMEWQEVPNTAVIWNWKNSTIQNCWGEDSGLFYIQDFTPNDAIGGTDNKLVAENMIFQNVERRALKGFSSNIYMYDCIFRDPAPNDQRIYSSSKSGLAVFGGDNNSGAEFVRCQFEGKGYDGRLIATGVTDFLIKDCVFKGGADIAFTQIIGNGRIENCTFESESTIYEYNAIFDGKLEIDSNNKAVDSNYIKLNPFNYILKLL